MRGEPTAPVRWVHLLQALVAREGVEQLGLSARRVAELLGLAPSAISQYLSGKRGESGVRRYATDDRARAIARRTLERLIEAREAGRPASREVLDGAAELSELARATPGAGATLAPVDPRELRALSRWLRDRVRAEQVAVAQCMRLAQRAGDELTRALLRQIASDSLRHAEIVASLGPYIDRGVFATYAYGVTRAEIVALIEGERRAEAQADVRAARRLKGTMAVLLASIEADERKHTALLRSLLEHGFRPSASPKQAHEGTGHTLEARG